MHMHVGPHVYQVVIAQKITGGRIGLADYLNRRLLVAACVPPAHRLDVILHELAHAFSYHFPSPTDEEAAANLTATIAASAMKDLARQGGVDVLMRMDSAPDAPDAPAAVVPVAAPVAVAERRIEPVTQCPTVASADRAQCACCETIVNGSAVWKGEKRPATEAESGVAPGEVVHWVIDRVMYCPHCDALQSWVETCSPGGWPAGVVVAGPVRVTDREAVAEFLERCPQAVGVIAE
jgi:hypothetical protein